MRQNILEMGSRAVRVSSDGERKTSRARPTQKLCGIFNRKERWGLSARGWLLLILFALITGSALAVGLHPFLAVTHRVNADVLVVEGWVGEPAAQAGAEEFKTGSYQQVFTTGGPTLGGAGFVSDYDTYANLGAAMLRKAGVPAERIQKVPAHYNGRDRTYTSAIALRDWFREHNLSVRSINIITEDAHARRTRLLFEKALGKDVSVGIIAIRGEDYDPGHWWRCSAGVRDVIGEGIAYVYARVLFHPSATNEQFAGANQ